MTLKTVPVLGPTVENICIGFGYNPFSGLGTILFTRFLWPSLDDLIGLAFEPVSFVNIIIFMLT